MRSRNIKPGYFKNEVLGEADPLAHILFSGLWCMADKAGRLEDRPKRIKAEILAYRDCDIDDLLWFLHEACFIQRYSVDGACFIQVSKWRVHQVPHHREKESEIPDIKQQDAEARPKQEPSKAEARAEQGRSKSSVVPLIPDSLIPDSGFLIPEKDASASAAPKDPKAIFWDNVVAVFGETGRAFAGKLIGIYGEQSVIEKLAATMAKNPADPKSYLVAALKKLAEEKVIYNYSDS